MPRLSSSILSFRIAIAAQEGGDINAIMDAAGVPRGVMQGDPPYVDLATECRAWLAMVDATEREDIGLLFGQRFPTQAMGILGYVCANAPSLSVAVVKSSQYQRVMGDSMGMQVERGPTQTRLWIEQWSPWYDPMRYTVDCFMAALISWGSANVPQPLMPKEVGFHYTPPNGADAHRGAFPTAHVRFGTEVSYQVYDNANLDQPIIGSNATLFQDFEERVQRVVRQIETGAAWSERVGRCVAEGLKGTTPTLDAVASQLSVNPRTLQARLNQEGTSFSEILNDARTELAKEFLKVGDVRNEEIAYLLGYSEESVFSRSFKKWTGLTPTQFRSAIA